MSEIIAGEWRGTGLHQEVSGLHRGIPDYDPRSGEHLWIVASVYRIADPAALLTEQWGYLDSENLLSVEGPGCYYCEQVWTARLGTRRCKGRP